MSSEETPDAIARALRACAQISCPKCEVEPWQHCRNRLAAAGWINTRFHKPRQMAAGAPAILGPVGIHHFRWQKVVSAPWTGAQIQSP
ncbi:hypothetical protein ACIPSA_51165 [Streptomyces sp. NPDC086549]|uniref:hypothetical protein n=1 Tax=Streptomyces sp. NPDC086549 TaxID=3365752 RepID=UPI0037F3FA41